MEKIKQQGFTLIELLITIAVVAILVSIAVPSFKIMVINNRIEASANRLRNGIVKARNLAMQRKTNVSLFFDSSGGIKSWDIKEGVASTVISSDDVAAMTLIHEFADDAGKTKTVVPEITFTQSGNIADTSDLTQRVFSVCYKESKEGVRGKAIVLSPSGLTMVKDENQMINNASDDSDDLQISTLCP